MTIKIVDEGGGIRRSDLQHVWSYMYSTAPKPTASQLTGVPLDHMSGKRTRRERGRGGRGGVGEEGVIAVLFFCVASGVRALLFRGW